MTAMTTTVMLTLIVEASHDGVLLPPGASSFLFAVQFHHRRRNEQVQRPASCAVEAAVDARLVPVSRVPPAADDGDQQPDASQYQRGVSHRRVRAIRVDDRPPVTSRNAPAPLPPPRCQQPITDGFSIQLFKTC